LKKNRLYLIIGIEFVGRYQSVTVASFIVFFFSFCLPAMLNWVGALVCTLYSLIT